MLKRVFALILCVVLLIPCLAACAERDELDLGPYITMYLTDEIYNFDPATAYYNSGTLSVVNMMFETLFELNEDGEVENALVDEYEIYQDKRTGEHKMDLILKEAYWSNGVQVNADDVIYAWKRLLNVRNDFESAALLFDIKNARAVKQGDESIDNLGLEAPQNNMVRITFVGDIDYDQFILNLTNVCTAPLPETYVEKDADWAKKASTIICSGPFKLGKTNYKNVVDENEEPVKIADDYALDKDGIPSTRVDKYNKKVLNYFYLERNSYYYRDVEHDEIDESVTPYRILVNCSMSDAEILEEYKAGHIFFVGNIPLSIRNDEYVKQQNVQVSDALSTFTCYLNENAVIGEGDDAVKLFAIKEVRQALSMVIDREKIAEAVVYAKAATALVPPAVLNAGEESDSFRSAGEDLIATSANKSEAERLLSTAGIDPEKYAFSINVAEYNDVHIAAVELIAAAWRDLGFDVTVKTMSTIQNNDVLKSLAGSNNERPTDICDDLFVESIQRTTYEVVAFDYVAYTADAYSMLANFAKSFAGRAVDMDNEIYDLVPHRTGYDSTDYNNLIEAIYYIPYFAELDRETSQKFLGIYETQADFQAAYDAVKAVYETYGINPTTDSSKWLEQKTQLLHEAEKLLVEDMPVIPVYFNQHAIMVNEDALDDIEANYYAPYYFRETTLEDYMSYTYEDKNGKNVSIFSTFPEIAWDKKGTSEFVGEKK